MQWCSAAAMQSWQSGMRRSLHLSSFCLSDDEAWGVFAWRMAGGFLTSSSSQPDKPLKESQRVWDSAWSGGLAHNDGWDRWMRDGLWCECKWFSEECGRFWLTSTCHLLYHCRAERELQADSAVSTIAAVLMEIHLVFEMCAAEPARQRGTAARSHQRMCFLLEYP